MPLLYPPTIKTFPDDNKVAVWFSLAVINDPVVDHVPVAGEYIAQMAVGLSMPCAVSPPTINTCPDCSNVAVCLLLPIPMAVVLVQSPVEAL